MTKAEKRAYWDLIFGWDSSHWIWKEWPKRNGYYYLKDAVATQISDPDMPF